MRRRLPATLLLLLTIGSLGVLRASRYDFTAQDREAILAPATAHHWAGTDDLGRDRAVRVSAALLICLTGAGLAAAVTTGLAATVGLLAAFSPAPIAGALMFLSDAFLSLPWFFLLMMVRAQLPLTASPAETAVATFLVLAALGWPACARAIYRGAIELRSAEWMLHGRTCGLRTGQLIGRHLAPHLRSLLLPQFLVCVPAFLVAEANLGALGLGVGEPMPSWGAMLLELDNSALLASSAWVYLPIGLLVVVLLILESFTAQEKADA